MIKDIICYHCPQMTFILSPNVISNLFLCCYSTLTFPWVIFTNIVIPRRQWQSSCSWHTQSCCIQLINILVWSTTIPNTETTPINGYIIIFMNKTRSIQYWRNRKMTILVRFVNFLPKYSKFWKTTLYRYSYHNYLSQTKWHFQLKYYLTKILQNIYLSL